MFLGCSVFCGFSFANDNILLHAVILFVFVVWTNLRGQNVDKSEKQNEKKTPERDVQES